MRRRLESRKVKGGPDDSVGNRLVIRRHWDEEGVRDVFCCVKVSVSM